MLEVVRFPTFAALLRHFGSAVVLPGIATDVYDGIQEYYKYKSRVGVSYKDLEKQHGVVGVVVATL